MRMFTWFLHIQLRHKNLFLVRILLLDWTKKITAIFILVPDITIAHDSWDCVESVEMKLLDQSFNTPISQNNRSNNNPWTCLTSDWLFGCTMDIFLEIFHTHWVQTGKNCLRRDDCGLRHRRHVILTWTIFVQKLPTQSKSIKFSKTFHKQTQRSIRDSETEPAQKQQYWISYLIPSTNALNAFRNICLSAIFDQVGILHFSLWFCRIQAKNYLNTTDFGTASISSDVVFFIARAKNRILSDVWDREKRKKKKPAWLLIWNKHDANILICWTVTALTSAA